MPLQGVGGGQHVRENTSLVHSPGQCVCPWPAALAWAPAPKRDRCALLSCLEVELKLICSLRACLCLCRMYLLLMVFFGFFMLRHQTVEMNYVIATSLTLFVIFVTYHAKIE